MSRWEPDAPGRLRSAALELFAAQGYEATTVAQIADRAGVTSRTFFRHFTDKPEVLFAGSEQLDRAMEEAVSAMPPGASPRAALEAGLTTAAALMDERADFARRRHRVIVANPALLERETMKMERLTTALAHALREREVDDTSAALLAHAGVAALRVAFAAWVEDESEPLAERTVNNLRLLKDSMA